MMNAMIFQIHVMWRVRKAIKTFFWHTSVPEQYFTKHRSVLQRIAVKLRWLTVINRIIFSPQETLRPCGFILMAPTQQLFLIRLLLSEVANKPLLHHPITELNKKWHRLFPDCVALPLARWIAPSAYIAFYAHSYSLPLHHIRMKMTASYLMLSAISTNIYLIKSVSDKLQNTFV